MTSEQRWTTAARVLAILVVVLGTIAGLEAVTVRRARAELQQLRSERDAAKVDAARTWIRQAADETGRAISALDDFYAESNEGFGRPGGLCPGSHLDVSPIVDYVLGGYLPARAEGRSDTAATAAMDTAVRATPAYRAIHPDLAPKSSATSH